MNHPTNTWAQAKITLTNWSQATKAWLVKYGPKYLGPIVAVVVVLVGFLLMTMGFKELQVGGLLGKILGKKDVHPKAIDVANTVDENRVNAKGQVIAPGVPDSNGDVQAVIVPIRNPGLLSDPNKVTFTAPGDAKPTTVTLPDGVTNRDVAQVVVVSPNVVAVTVKDSSKSKVDAKHIDEILKRYGR